MPPDEITTREAARILGVTPRRVRALITAGRLVGRLADGRTLVADRASVMAFRRLPPGRKPPLTTER